MNPLVSSLLLSLLLSAVSPQDLLSRPLKRRQLPNQTGSSPFPSALFDPAGSNRSLDPTNPGPSPADPAAPSPLSSSPSPSPSPTPKDSTLGDSLLPLLGSPPPLSTPSPILSPSPTPSSSIRSLSPSPTSLASPSTPPASTPTPLPPRRGQPSTTNPSPLTEPSASPTSSPDSQPNRTSRPPPRKTDDSASGFGSTTIKLIGIVAAVVAGLFLLWTVIRKWKFSPSKRFAKKLDEYDEDVFAPRPPSFGEKRAQDHQAYSIPNASNLGSPYASHYPSYPERSASPSQKLPYPNDPLQGSQAYQAHRLSHISVTQPPVMFEPNPYRLSLGFGNTPHAYPPSDHPKPTVM